MVAASPVNLKSYLDDEYKPGPISFFSSAQRQTGLSLFVMSMVRDVGNCSALMAQGPNRLFWLCEYGSCKVTHGCMVDFGFGCIKKPI